MFAGQFVPMVTYVLELENGKWYVGKSMNLNNRMGNHLGSEGSKWTKTHRIKRIERVVLGDREKELTLQYMVFKGWQNVRGYSWCQVQMKKPPVCLRSVIETPSDD